MKVKPIINQKVYKHNGKVLNAKGEDVPDEQSVFYNRLIAGRLIEQVDQTHLEDKKAKKKAEEEEVKKKSEEEEAEQEARKKADEEEKERKKQKKITGV